MKSFSVVYQFKVAEENHEEFILAWSELTELIKEYSGGLGSVLNQLDAQTFIAYAQWPDEDHWQNSKLPESANDIRARMKKTLIESSTIYKMKIIKDQLV